MRKVKVGLIEVKQREEDGVLKRLEILLEFAEECFKRKADIVFFPEAYPFVPDRDIKTRYDELVAVTSDFHKKCSNLAKKYHGYLVPWEYEYANGKVYNSSYVLDRNGEEIGRYRKVHLTRGEIEGGLTCGNSFPVFKLDFGKVGIMICFDNYFPESVRCLSNNGAELILYPLYGDTLVPGWEIKTRARAIDNTVFIAAEQIDGICKGAFTGLIAPNGDIIEKSWGGEGVKVVEIDLDEKTYTNLNAKAGELQDIKRYLALSRNPLAYKDVLKPVKKDCYEDIFFTSDKS